MAYNALAQDLHETASNASGSDASEPSPRPNRLSFQRLSLDVANLGGSNYMGAAKIADQPSPVSLGSVIRSLGPASAAASYDMLEHDDFALPDPAHNDTSSRPVLSRSSSRYRHVHSASPEPIIQSPVSARPVPLRHPTPDLQSLQGAYVGNVERLEKSAEHLSMTSDIGEELRKLKLEQKRQSSVGSASPTRKFSTSSLSNSIIGVNTIARSSGYSPAGYIVSPRGSIMSASSSQAAARVRSGSVASRLAQVPEPENEDLAATQFQNFSSPPILPAPEPSTHFLGDHNAQFPDAGQSQPTDNEIPEDRPGTAGSTDTYRQSTALFKDFDGVHFTTHTKKAPPSHRVSLSKPPLARESKSFNHPASGKNMVYYPAPVPMVLNLPQRLSKRPANPEPDRRRTQVIDTLPADARKSGAWLPPIDGIESPEQRQSKRLSELPPQLRASVFFEQQPTQLDIQIKQNSAVATLDSILDAAAEAPVSAFTDHPIAGHVGSEVYGKSKLKKSSKPKADKKADKKRQSIGKPLDVRHSMAAPQIDIHDIPQDGGNQIEAHAAENSGESTPFRKSYDGDATGPRNSTVNFHDDGSRLDHDNERNEDGREGSNSPTDDEDEEEETYVGKPTTLLAELQMRKQEQKQRNRTAATAFPNGMHSTLLELDAVAQHQRQTRNQKHITLAWEDPGIADQQEPDDEDVPLAVLFPKNVQADENRPMGLMEKLQLEENEPLSRRRARIRGEPPVIRNPSPQKRSSMYTLDLPNLRNDDDDDDGEEETLAQRARRLKAHEAAAAGGSTSNDFASELLGQFGAKEEPEAAKEATPPTELEEETLGQRRKRLQAEAQARAAAGGGTEVTPVAENIAPPVKSRHSMANILQAHPARHQINNPYINGNAPRQSSQPAFRLQPQPIPNRMSMNTTQQPPYGNGYGNVNGNNSTKYAMNLSSHLPLGSAGAYGNGYGKGYGNGTQYYPTGINNLGTGLAYGYEPHMAAQQSAVIDSGQRDMIDRWRQSVRE
ncbi:hypothetical protein FQN55_004525 [Onygenales sp. PD_40]|nr:hypothetical protein FQN55_004525 [Onygenales sp. PD_40]KAK2775800.1 hypothetical protein FQN52_003879 [Onygenales sp. PD_12]